MAQHRAAMPDEDQGQDFTALPRKPPQSTATAAQSHRSQLQQEQEQGTARETDGETQQGIAMASNCSAASDPRETTPTALRPPAAVLPPPLSPTLQLLRESGNWRALGNWEGRCKCGENRLLFSPCDPPQHLPVVTAWGEGPGQKLIWNPSVEENPKKG